MVKENKVNDENGEVQQLSSFQYYGDSDPFHHLVEMEFKFNVNKLLPRKINKVTHNLVPEDFKGDRRELK